MLERIKKRVQLLDERAAKKPAKKATKKPVKKATKKPVKKVKKVKIENEMSIMPVGNMTENIQMDEVEATGDGMAGPALKVLIGLMTPIIQYELTKLYKNMREKKNI